MNPPIVSLPTFRPSEPSNLSPQRLNRHPSHVTRQAGEQLDTSMKDAPNPATSPPPTPGTPQFTVSDPIAGASAVKLTEVELAAEKLRIQSLSIYDLKAWNHTEAMYKESRVSTNDHWIFFFDATWDLSAIEESDDTKLMEWILRYRDEYKAQGYGNRNSGRPWNVLLVLARLGLTADVIAYDEIDVLHMAAITSACARTIYNGKPPLGWYPHVVWGMAINLSMRSDVALLDPEPLSKVGPYARVFIPGVGRRMANIFNLDYYKRHILRKLKQLYPSPQTANAGGALYRLFLPYIKAPKKEDELEFRPLPAAARKQLSSQAVPQLPAVAMVTCKLVRGKIFNVSAELLAELWSTSDWMVDMVKVLKVLQEKKKWSPFRDLWATTFYPNHLKFLEVDDDDIHRTTQQVRYKPMSDGE